MLENELVIYSVNLGEGATDAGKSPGCKTKLYDNAFSVPTIFSSAIADNISSGINMENFFNCIKKTMQNNPLRLCPVKEGKCDFVF